MKNINIKKLFSGFISLCIIAGMALVTFATDVDMAAFVTKDEYLTKYHEIDYRVSDIDDRLDRLYKLTCTNVRSFGGTGSYGYDQNEEYFSFNGGYIRGTSFFRYNRDSGAVRHWYYHPILSFREEGYLKFGTPFCVNMAFALVNEKTDTLEKSYPATMLKWRDGIEPASNCSLNITITRVDSNKSGYNTDNAPQSESWEIIMGPFDKYPNPTSAGSALNQGFVCSLPEAVLPQSLSFDTFEYQTGTETEPTTWKSLNRGSSTLNSNMIFVGDTANGGGDAYKQSYLDTEAYHNRYIGVAKSGLYYATALPSAVPAANGNIWLRFSKTGSQLMKASIDSSAYNLTSWNLK